MESTPERYDSRPQYYYHQPGTGATHVKRLPRSVVFGSNSHLNSLQETKVNKDIDKMKGGEKPVTGPSLGSEPQLNRLQDLQEEKVSKKNSILSHSVSNLYLNSSNSNAKLYAPHGEFSSYSELDKSEDLKLRRTSAVKPGNMIFSSSTSDLLNLKRNRILPSLSRHRNCEHLDVSDECLDKVDIIKHENLHYRPENEMLLDDAPYGNKSKNSCETCSSSTEKMFTGRNLTNNYSDGQFRRTAEMGRMNSDRADNSHSIHNIQLVQNEDGSERPFNNVSLKNLEVGSERRCRRVKKIPKIDHNNFQDHKNRADSVTRRQFMVGCGQGYEAVIQKMSNNCRVRIRDKFDGKNASERDQFTPLYKRCDTRNSGYSGSSLETRNFNALDEFNSIRPKQMNEHRASTLAIDPVDSKIINSTDLSDAKEHHDNLPPLIVANRDLFELKEVESKKTGRMRCAMCKKRLSIATVHTCRCGVVFCAPHRYAEIHGCRYDYKAEGQEYLRRANPLVSAPKLPKI